MRIVTTLRTTKPPGIIGGSEQNAPDTWRFSIDVVKKWERELNAAATPLTRKVLMRSAIVMSPSRNGPFDMFLKLVRFGLGGRFGDGKSLSRGYMTRILYVLSTG